MDFKKLQSYSLLVGLIVATGAVLYTVSAYIFPIFWAAVLAAVFYPVFRWLEKRTGGRSTLAASVSLALVVLVFLIPLTGLVALIVQQAIVVYREFGNQATIDAIGNTLGNFLNQPIIERYFGTIDIQGRLQAVSGDISRVLYQFITNSGQMTATIVIQFFIMLYTLFFFFRDGRSILQRLMYLLPLGDNAEQRLFERFVSTAKATLKGTVVIGAIQGTIGGIAFAVTGVPGWAFWSVIMIVLSVIPALGAGIVLVPAIIIFAILGMWWQAIVILAAALFAGIIDNILRGPLVGKDVQMHPLWIFFATLGGLVTFGISGVVIGPIIVAFCLSLWEVYAERYKSYLKQAD